ncbi:hypothetical protein CLV78_107137 [Aliiruegeria haliotis]|uniref:Uncharacterized protein n=1 Tax=Aliiruegeria haliotis TaxID=1280846 RepID=A0A2T0RM72_9RHOB|nr:hypothetical protein CLV78_107137 [Aliiruegeria haliotis]
MPACTSSATRRRPSSKDGPPVAPAGRINPTRIRSMPGFRATPPRNRTTEAKHQRHLERESRDQGWQPGRVRHEVHLPNLACCPCWNSDMPDMPPLAHGNRSKGFNAMPPFNHVTAVHRLDLLGLRSLLAAAETAIRNCLGLQWDREQRLTPGIAPSLPDSATTMYRGFVAADADRLERSTVFLFEHSACGFLGDQHWSEPEIGHCGQAKRRDGDCRRCPAQLEPSR